MKCCLFFNFFIVVKRYICILLLEECFCIIVVIFLFNCIGMLVVVSLFIKYGENQRSFRMVKGIVMKNEVLYVYLIVLYRWLVDR